MALNEIVTTNKLDISPLSPIGITAAEMTPQQRDLLMKVVSVYTSKMTDDIAADRMAKLQKAGIEKIAFAWAGEAERGKKHYYRIQGPTFLVNMITANNGNHVHSIWRDFNGDFGRVSCGTISRRLCTNGKPASFTFLSPGRARRRGCRTGRSCLRGTRIHTACRSCTT